MREEPNRPATYDVVVVGGGPAGLSAALALGRGRKRVLLCDAGPRRNATAVQVHNFVTRDGVTPNDFRRIGREQLAHYPNVEIRDSAVTSVTGPCGAFSVVLADESGPVVVEARRIILATGMLDELPALPGLAEAWGHSVFQCPYCHGWEHQSLPWGYLASARDAATVQHFALLLRGWTNQLVVFTNGAFELPAETHESLHAAGVRIETDPISNLVVHETQLMGVALASRVVRCDVLFAHPPQRQIALVHALGLALDDHGFVAVDAMRPKRRCAASMRPGI